MNEAALMLVIRDRFPSNKAEFKLVASMAVPDNAKEDILTSLKSRVKAQRMQHRHSHRAMLGKVPPLPP